MQAYLFNRVSGFDPSSGEYNYTTEKQLHERNLRRGKCVKFCVKSQG